MHELHPAGRPARRSNAVFGTNPFAYGLPAKRHPPVVLDIATIVVAMQKVRVAAWTSEPEGLIFDRAGRPTTDPAEFFDGVPSRRWAVPTPPTRASASRCSSTR